MTNDSRPASDGQTSSTSLSRRSLLRLTGTGVLVGSAGLATRSSAADAQVAAPAPTLPPPPDLSVVQGNSLLAFGTSSQRLMLLRLPDGDRARGWLATVRPLLTSCQDVEDHRTAFRTGTASPRGPWSALAFSSSGLRALGVPASEVGLFPEEFQEGMRARAALLGDVGPHAPETWVAPYAGGNIHAVLIAAADGARAADALVARHRRIMSSYGVEILGIEVGQDRVDQPHHEHFGFLDGISQPGVRGVTQSHDPVGNPSQGDHGQDLLWPGEFVLGHPTQDARPGADGGFTAPGPVSTTGPSWATNGSFVVFRRLRQDVPGFRAMIASAAAQVGMGSEQIAAKLVGRWPSGASVLATPDADRVDPSIADASVLDPQRINDFEFGDDLDGVQMPRCAHIRKTYPRDEELPTGGEAATQTHRLLRRGIQYGPSYDASPETRDADRGLLFIAYQSSIGRQFEFVQRRWVNDPNVPEAGDGQDPLIATGATPPVCRVQTATGEKVVQLTTVVTTTGGEYFFQPSLPAIAQLAAGPPAPRQDRTARGGDSRRGPNGGRGGRRSRDGG